MVTKKTWKVRGKGKGFGYVSFKVTKLICNPMISPVPLENMDKVLGVGEQLVKLNYGPLSHASTETWS